VILINHGEDTFVVRRGDRIAQLVVSAVVQADIQLVSTLADTERGMGGFGHTGG
jgi:dUTP pyrophosphatase